MKTISTAIACLGAAASIAAQEKKPNVLLILADDLGYNDLGYQGSKHIKTPNLDKLASQSVRFTDAHVTSPVCSPSRAGLLTGRYQQRFGHEGNCPRRPDGMDVNEKTMAQALKEQGYKTALFGKWHLGDEKHQYPTVRGFDEFWGLREGSRHYYFKKNDLKGDKPHSIEHNGKAVEWKGHLTDRLTDRTIEYIDNNKENPFFIFLSYTAPHTPLQSAKEDLEALGTQDNYAGLVYGMDRNIGRVIKSLEDNKLMDNTIIWFLSDNGGTVKQASNLPLGGKKGTEFEGGHRVPMLMYWKGKVPAGKDYNELVSSMDIYATSIKAAGGSLKQERPLDGKDLTPFLNKTVKGIPHKALYFRKLECASIRVGDWKMIRVDKLGYGLYDLKKDIGENKNLAKQMPEKLDELKTMLKKWEKDKINPLWSEGVKWEKVRYNDHKVKFETGVLPGFN